MASEIDKEIFNYTKKINTDIGFYWWKRYFYSAFWGNISTPLNLAITIFTALTTGQYATNGLLSESATTALGVTTLIISIFNTFFRPNEHLNENKKIMTEWANLGNEFETIYYDMAYGEEEKKLKLNNLQTMFKTITEQKRTNPSNPLIDLMYTACRKCCLKNEIEWIQRTDELVV